MNIEPWVWRPELPGRELEKSRRRRPPGMGPFPGRWHERLRLPRHVATAPNGQSREARASEATHSLFIHRGDLLDRLSVWHAHFETSNSGRRRAGSRKVVQFFPEFFP